jgi:C_GCAxxG_C_C family probable redox protein
VTKADLAETCFADGFMCSQAVLSAFADDLGLPRPTALKIAEAFGGGMGLGETCGAVTGALMVIGLKHGRTEADDGHAKERTKELTRQFIEQFRARHDTIVCKALLNTDVSTPQGLQHARDTGLFDTLCPLFVRDAAEIVESLL